MAQTKVTPRQRMINMMYIVLIALLALTVDQEILKAFHHMEKNFISSIESYDQKTAIQMASFNRAMEEKKVKAQPFYDSAIVAQQVSRDFILYIESLKKEIEELYDGREENVKGSTGIAPLKKPDMIEAHANYFLVQENGQRAKELQDKINGTRNRLLGMLNPKKNNNFLTTIPFNLVSKANLLAANEPENSSLSKATWATENIEYQPAGALMALLSQYQQNAKSLESDVIDQLLKGVDMSSIPVDGFSAQIMAESNYVMEGEAFVADVLLVATNTSGNHKIKVNGSALTTVERGVGKVSIPAQGVGVKKVSGEILVDDPITGKPTPYFFEKEYQVFKPIATVAAEKMNLAYIGLKNPLSISVPGFSAADISVRSTSGGSISGGNGQYNLKVDGSQAKVSVAVFANGRNMGSTQFRVRSVPAPQPNFGGLPSNRLRHPKSAVCAQQMVLARMTPDFAYDLTWRVTEFTIVLAPKNRPGYQKRVQGNQIPSNIRSMICQLNSGDRLLFERMTAVDRNGISKKMDPIVITIQ